VPANADPFARYTASLVVSRHDSWYSAVNRSLPSVVKLKFGAIAIRLVGVANS
jgi:hypothetical protein